LLGGDYDGVSDLNSRIAYANSTTNQAVACAARRGFTLSTTDQELIERAIAAYRYTQTDPVYLSKNTGGASGTFVRGETTKNPYKEMAIETDVSGCVNALLNRKVAGLHNVGGGQHHHHGGH